MKLSALLASAFFVALLSSAATAGPVVEAAERVEDLLEDGQPLEALEALEAAVEAVWEESPLLFRETVLVESVEGRGAFEERADAVFRPDETLRVYVEPVGYGFGRSPQGYSIALTTDVAIRNTTGQVLVDVDDAFSLEVETGYENRDLHVTLAFGVPYLYPGDYIATFTLRDQNSDKAGSFEVPFTIAGPVAGTAEGGDEPDAASDVEAEDTRPDIAADDDDAAPPEVTRRTRDAQPDAPADGAPAEDAAAEDSAPEDKTSGTEEIVPQGSAE